MLNKLIRWFKPTDRLVVSPSPSHSSTQDVGERAERAARLFLLDRGMVFKENNYRCKVGEIDLIMTDKTSLVFVEVRSRNNPRFGTGFETVNHTKQQRLIRAAKHYLQSKKLTDRIPCRFDVVSVDNNTSASSAESRIQWIPDAFDVKA